MKSKKRIKFFILCRPFNFPIVWLSLTAIPGIFDFKPASLVAFGVVMIASLGVTMLDTSKFLIEMKADGEKYLITYLTPLARERQLVIRFSTVVKTKIKEKKLLVRDFTSINFYSKDNRIEFLLVDDSLKDDIRFLLEQPLTSPATAAESLA